MNAAARMLRELAEAGAVDTCPCPCRAQGRFVELEPNVFQVKYEHDDDCPVLTRRTSA